MDVIATFFNAANLPATVLLLLISFYWLLVILGLFDLELFDFDLSSEPASGGDGITDLTTAAAGAGGIFKAVLGFFYLGRVPMMILLSGFALIFWVVTTISNHYFNPEGEVWLMLYTWVPTMIGSLLLTKLVFWPMAPLFDELHKPTPEMVNTLIGKVGTVTTSEVTESFGQIAIEQQGPPIVLNVRAASMDRFTRGDAVQIVSHDSNNNTYLIASVGGKK